MNQKYIRIDDHLPSRALQKFAKAIEEAVREDFTVSNDVKHAAREVGFAQFDITMVKRMQPLQQAALDAETDHIFGGAVNLPGFDIKNQMRALADPQETAITTFPPGATLPLAILESLKTKQELLDFAEKHGITVPEELKVVTAVKKYLKEQFAPTDKA